MRVTQLEEKKKKQTAVMYHGTSDVFLKSILKNGLLANPPKQTYSGEEDNPFGSSVRTFGGVYFTSSRKYAETIARDAIEAHGGNPLIVTLQIVLGSMDIDEDLINNPLSRSIVNYYLYIAEKAPNRTESIALFVADYIENNETEFKRIVSNELIEELSDYGKIGYTVKSLIYQLCDIFLKMLKRVGDFELSYLFNSPLDFLRDDNEFEEIVSKIMNNVFSKQTTGQTAYRVTKDIGYRGKNKILKIETLDDRKIHYIHPELKNR